MTQYLHGIRCTAFSKSTGRRCSNVSGISEDTFECFVHDSRRKEHHARRTSEGMLAAKADRELPRPPEAPPSEDPQAWRDYLAQAIARGLIEPAAANSLERVIAGSVKTHIQAMQAVRKKVAAEVSS